MNHFWTSDLHFHHENIQRFTGRPWDVEEQTERLIEIWNAQVGPNDFAHHLGDFCFGKNKEESIEKIVKRLNGRIGFVLGNHDKDSHFENLVSKFANVEYVNRFQIVKVGKRYITMCHYPLYVWDASHHGSWSIHGHCHGTFVHPGRSLDVGIDNAFNVLGEYRMFDISDLERYFRGREASIVDGHTERTT